VCLCVLVVIHGFDMSTFTLDLVMVVEHILLHGINVPNRLELARNTRVFVRVMPTPPSASSTIVSSSSPIEFGVPSFVINSSSSSDIATSSQEQEEVQLPPTHKRERNPDRACRPAKGYLPGEKLGFETSEMIFLDVAFFEG
jgi:hypothetical protein